MVLPHYQYEYDVLTYRVVLSPGVSDSGIKNNQYILSPTKLLSFPIIYFATSV